MTLLAKCDACGRKDHISNMSTVNKMDKGVATLQQVLLCKKCHREHFMPQIEKIKLSQEMAKAIHPEGGLETIQRNLEKWAQLNEII